MLIVKITNKSPLMLGSGTGKGTFIDGDIIFDTNGLPYFPGRRFKGLLKESALEVLEMFETCHIKDAFSPDIFENTFGTSTIPTGIQINNFYLYDDNLLTGQKYKTLEEWLKYFQQEEKYKKLVNQEAITNSLTEIRQQTAIDKDGYAKENSLRTTRVMKANLCFSGKIEIVRKDIEFEMEALLAMAVLNLRKVGSGRNRGWGQVECELFKTDNLRLDLGKELINKLRQDQKLSFRKVEQAAVEDTKDTSGGLKKQEKKEKSKRVYLPYEITNLSPLLFTSPDGDENMVNTLDFISGAGLRGYYANQYIRENSLSANSAHLDERFRSWFLERAFFFSNAYPVFEKGVNGNKFSFYPTPLFFHQDKKGETFYSLLNKTDDDTEFIGGYFASDGSTIYKEKPKKIVNFHLVRNKNKRKNRARIDGHVQEEGIFHYEAIETEQTFHGHIAGTEEELKDFLKAFEGKKYIRLGRSLNTQYGQAEIKFKKIVTNLEELYGDFMDFEGAGNEELEQGQILLYLLSPLLLTNDWGFYSTSVQDLIEYLQKKLGVDLITIEKSFARTESSQVFASHLKVHEPSFRTWTQGTSFLLQLKDKEGNPVVINEDLKRELYSLMSEGLGEKKEQGYGQVFLSTKKPGTMQFLTEEKRAGLRIEKPQGEMPIVVKDILHAIYKDNLDKLAIAAALTRASYLKDKVFISNSLLGRLVNICESSKKQNDFQTNILKLQDKAKKQLEKTTTEKGKNLYEELMEPNYATWCLNANSHSWEHLQRLGELLGFGEEAFANQFDYKLYWRIFFSSLRKMKNETKGGENSAN